MLVVHATLYDHAVRALTRARGVAHVVALGGVDGSANVIEYGEWTSAHSAELDAEDTHREDFGTLNYSSGTHQGPHRKTQERNVVIGEVPRKTDTGQPVPGEEQRWPGRPRRFLVRWLAVGERAAASRSSCSIIPQHEGQGGVTPGHTGPPLQGTSQVVAMYSGPAGTVRPVLSLSPVTRFCPLATRARR